jgi:hypothetical protein
MAISPAEVKQRQAVAEFYAFDFANEDSVVARIVLGHHTALQRRQRAFQQGRAFRRKGEARAGALGLGAVLFYLGEKLGQMLLLI